MNSKKTGLRASNIRKSFGSHEVLHDISVNVFPGEVTLINGPSGSGKTTLLNIMSGILRPDSGMVLHEETNVTDLNDKRLTKWRSRTGQAFQSSGLIAGRNVIENITDPHVLTGQSLEREHTEEVCDRLGIAHLLGQSAISLSGGEAQRVGLARALAHKPDIVFGDEVTAPLDVNRKHDVYSFLSEYAQAKDTPVVLVSHEDIARRYADSVVTLEDGRIKSSDDSFTFFDNK